MGGFIAPKPPPPPAPDPALEAARAEREASLKAENDAMKAKQAEAQDAINRRLRGSASLFTAGFRGFSQGSNGSGTLGV